MKTNAFSLVETLVSLSIFSFLLLLVMNVLKGQYLSLDETQQQLSRSVALSRVENTITQAIGTGHNKILLHNGSIYKNRVFEKNKLYSFTGSDTGIIPVSLTAKNLGEKYLMYTFRYKVENTVLSTDIYCEVSAGSEIYD